jgi:cation diffusion facilitator family transporter
MTGQHGQKHHDHDHSHKKPWPHSHEAADRVDEELESSAEGMRALKLSFVGLGATAVVQGAIVALTGSVALLGDTLHNGADALTALPLAVAFMLGRKMPTRRYGYGYGRAEDLAGVAVVLVILASSLTAAWVAIDRLAHPQKVTHLLAVALAALLGFAGNELVARYRIRTGRRIGSAALVADGLHARTDGFTSLGVLVGVGGAALGWTWADPVVGLLILLPIAVVGWHAAREVGRRLMDSVDPALTDAAEHTLREVPGVLGVGDVRMRWTGHRLLAECEIQVDPVSSAIAAHQVTVESEHALIHAVPRLVAAVVHADPYPADGADYHAPLATHGSVHSRNLVRAHWDHGYAAGAGRVRVRARGCGQHVGRSPGRTQGSGPDQSRAAGVVDRAGNARPALHRPLWQSVCADDAACRALRTAVRRPGAGARRDRGRRPASAGTAAGRAT